MFTCKSYVIQSFLNYSGVIYSLFTIFSQLFVEGYFTCPQLYGREQCRVPILFGYFLIFEIMLNFILFHYNSKYNKVTSLLPDAKRLPMPPMQKIQRVFTNQSYNNNINPNSVLTHNLPANSIPPADDENTVLCNLTDNSYYTKYCFTCQMTVPQRCHHCPLCNYCILKKDHHCFMVGGCVGFGNQRYFLVFLFWASIGAAYGTSYAARYLNHFYQPFFPFGWIDYIFPLAMKRWIFFQHCSIYQLGMVLIFTLGAGGSGVASVFFVVQWYHILRGQTMFESGKKQVIADGSSKKQRIESIFGPYWLVNFIFPTPYKNKLDESFKKIVYDYYVKEL